MQVLKSYVNQYESTIHAVHLAARTHTQKSKNAVGPAVDYRPQGEALPVISSDLTSELLHCLSTLPDPWPLAKITKTWRNRASGSPNCADSTLLMSVSCSWLELICHSYGPYVSIFVLISDFHCLRNCKDRV